MLDRVLAVLVQAGIDFLMLLPSRSWDYRCVSLYS